MSETPRDHGRGEQHTDSGPLSGSGVSRRTFVKAAGASAGGLAVGASASGTASAEPQIPTPQLQTDGNVLVDPEGNTVTLRGVNMIDPRRADTMAPYRGKNAVQMVDLLTDQSEGWHTQVIRLPLQPSDIGELETGYCNGPATPPAFTREQLQAYLDEHVDPVVDACEEAGVYVILDYHRHWTGSSAEENNTEFDGKWADGDADPPEPHQALQDECVTFWDVVANRYGDRSHTIYEVYNEPTEPGIWGDPKGENGGNWAINWVGFVNFIQPAIDQIAEHTDNLQLLGSPSWTQAPEGILVEESDLPDWAPSQGIEYRQIDEPENLAMTYHTYPGHAASRNQNWGEVGIEASGTAAGDTAVHEEYPLFVTEFGWDNSLFSQYLSGTTSDFGEPFFEWMESSDAISYTAWCGDIWWDPTMFERGFEGTDTDICDPYSAEIPQDCESLPCEWNLLGTTEDTYDDHMGQFVKEQLAQYSDHNNPSGSIDPTAPDAPSDLGTSEVTQTAITLEWDSVFDADTYHVYLDGEQVASTSDTTYTAEGLAPDTSYEIGVQAENDVGTSDRVSITETTLADGETPVCESAEGGSAEVDGQTVCDVNGDGLYRDVTGDGSVGQTDVVEFFEVQHRDAWKQPELFDFSGNGDVGHGDVVRLFEDVATGAV